MMLSSLNLLWFESLHRTKLSSNTPVFEYTSKQKNYRHRPYTFLHHVNMVTKYNFHKGLCKYLYAYEAHYDLEMFVID